VLRSNLREALRQGPLAPDVVFKLLEQFAAALAIAHQRGVIHRDIKPDNILLDEYNNAYLADFGIAKRLNVYARQRLIIDVGGSPAYMAPRTVQRRSHRRVDRHLQPGIVLYEMLKGEKP